MRSAPLGWIAVLAVAVLASCSGGDGGPSVTPEDGVEAGPGVDADDDALPPDDADAVGTDPAGETGQEVVADSADAPQEGSPDAACVGCPDPFSELCKPCMSDDDCTPPLGAAAGKHLCIDRGADGSFCGTPCATAGDCPGGYACTAAGSNAMQCVPLGGAACPCTARFASEGYETACYREKGDMKCFGKRTCDQACDAREPAEEACNNEDDDCDGQTDEDVAPHACPITVGENTCMGTSACVGHKEVCQGTPPSPETCNGKDDDCDGETDEEGALKCQAYFKDADEDGYGAKGDMKCLCAPAKPYTAENSGDCLDDDKDVHPGAKEVCNGKDDDCNGVTDPPDLLDCTLFYYDGDGDGWGVPGATQCTCAGTGKFTATTADDCDDADKEAHPGATEYCNGKDDNCAAGVDEEGAEWCETYYFDYDKDGYGTPENTKCLCGPMTGWVKKGGDCADGDKSVHPGVTEYCNGKDDNCIGGTDEEDSADCKPYLRDEDGDGWGVTGDAKCLCGPTAPYVVLQSAGKDGDCNDLDDKVNPGVAEVCTPAGGTKVDEDCDGQTDEGGDEVKPSTGSAVYYKDADGDGWGVTTDWKRLCAAEGAYKVSDPAKKGDCCDSDTGAHPDPAGEIQLMDHATACQTSDWNCDGSVTMTSNVAEGRCQGMTCGTKVTGWFIDNGVPACFTTGQWVTGCDWKCDENFSAVLQKCK